MKKLFIVLGILLFGFVQPTYAHVLQTDDAIGAVLHISPEDDPVAGETSAFSFEFKDTKNKFNPKNCDCTVRVFQHEKEIYSQVLSQKKSEASFTYTFPEKDIYTVKVIGKPVSLNSFQPFTLSYDIRVANDDNTSTKIDESSQIVFLVLAGIVLFFIIIYILKRIKTKNNK